VTTDLRVARLLIALAAALALTVAPGAAAKDTPRCYGAASRDPLKPCENPSLRLKVTPTPGQALLKPNAICNVLHVEDLVRACWFGARKAEAKTTVALMGDSHAAHWRAGLAPIAARRKWRGISVMHTSCPLSRVVSVTPKAKAEECRKWNDEALQWLDNHPEVTTVIVAEGTTARPGFETQVQGFRDAWKRIPHTVRNIIVIRDNPHMQPEVPVCVQQAMRDKQPAGEACKRERSRNLPPDPAVEAVRRMHSTRIHVVDLTPFFCDASWCYPVIGGVLVYKDTTHITSAYAKTVAPYLERAILRLKIEGL